MGKSSTGAAAADALAKILGVYLTTSAKEKDRAIDERRWQAQFELDKKRSEVEMQRAIREQAAYDRAQAEDKDINGILSSLQSQGITPPSGVDTRHELTSWLNIQNDLQDAAYKKAREARDAEEFPFRKKLLEAQANAANNRGSGKTGGKPKNLRDWIPDFMLPEYDMVDNELRATDKEFELEKARLASIDDADSEGKKAIENKLKSLEEKRVGLGQRLGEMGFAVVKGGVDSPEKWDAYNSNKYDPDLLEQKMMEKQQKENSNSNDTVKPREKSWWDRIAPTNEAGQPKSLSEMGPLETAAMVPKYAGVAAMDAADAAVSSVGPRIPNLLHGLTSPFLGPPPANYSIPGTGKVFIGDGVNKDKVRDWFGLNNIAPKHAPDSADSWYAPRTGTSFGRRY